MKTLRNRNGLFFGPHLDLSKVKPDRPSKAVAGYLTHMNPCPDGGLRQAQIHCHLLGGQEPLIGLLFAVNTVNGVHWRRPEVTELTLIRGGVSKPFLG